MSEKIERCAKVVHEELSRENVMAYLDMPDDVANDVAKAVIAAMREPSEGMVTAAIPAYDCDHPAKQPDTGEEHCSNIWQAMIDAALS
jgi:hypothetical protein